MGPRSGLGRVRRDGVGSADEGIWEVRGPRRHFTHSKVMAWVALDRAVKAVEHFHVDGPVERWRRLRDTIHAQICHQGFDPHLNSFVQAYGTQELDASLLMTPLVGFSARLRPPGAGHRRGDRAPPHVGRPRVPLYEYLVGRWIAPGRGGLPGVYLLASRHLQAPWPQPGCAADLRAPPDLRNDVGLLSEEYDLQAQRLVGNFPQALSHIGLVTTALNLSHGEAAPAEERQRS